MNTLNPDLERIILPADIIEARIKALAAQIEADYADADHLYLIGILKGAFIFLADLSRLLTIPHTVDFMSVSSYGRRGAHAGEVRMVLDVRDPIANQHVIIVEDIIDSGNTLHYLQETLLSRQPASLRTCVFVRKERRQIEVPIDYLGFEIPDVWVVGYGLDYAEKHRTLPYVAELKQEAH